MELHLPETDMVLGTVVRVAPDGHCEVFAPTTQDGVWIDRKYLRRVGEWLIRLADKQEHNDGTAPAGNG